MKQLRRNFLISLICCAMALPVLSVATEQKAPPDAAPRTETPALPWTKGGKCTLRNFTPDCRDFLRLKQARLLSRQQGTMVDPELMTYACDMQSTSAQCRTLSVLKTSVQTIVDLEEGCTSMGGTFAPGTCPDTSLLARCNDIVRNDHKPDVIYDNHYYVSADTTSTPSDIARICQNLGGHFSDQTK